MANTQATKDRAAAIALRGYDAQPSPAEAARQGVSVPNGFRYIVQRVPDTLTFSILDTKTQTIYGTYAERVFAQHVTANLNRADARKAGR